MKYSKHSCGAFNLRSTFFRGLLACMFLLAFVCETLAQTSTHQARMHQIVKQVMRADSSLTPEIHKEFWMELSNFSAKEQADFLRMMEVAVVMAHAYQVEVWESALVSFRKKKAYRSARMLSVEAELRSKILDTLPKDLPESAKQASAKEFDSKFLVSVSNASQLIHSAANHQPFQSPERGELILSEPTLTATIARLSETRNRLQRLFDPVWAAQSTKGANSSSSIEPKKSSEGPKPKESTDDASSADRARQHQRVFAASLIHATTPERLQILSDIDNFNQRVKAESKPNALEMVGAAIAGNTSSVIYDALFRDRFEPVVGYKPMRKELPPDADTTLIDRVAESRSPAETAQLVQDWQNERIRVNAVMSRGQAVGLLLQYGSALAIAAVISIVFIVIRRRRRLRAN